MSKTGYINKEDNVIKVSTRDIAQDICEMFENLLDTYGIDIPDEDREDNETEAHLYGTNYAICEDAITGLLNEIVGDITDSVEELTVDNISQSVECVDNYNGTMGYMNDMYAFENKEEMER